MHKNNLLVGTTFFALAVAMATPAMAQEAAPPLPASDCIDADEDGACDDQDDVILVTGSRIPRPAFEGTIPGATVTAEQLEARAFTNVLDALNDIPLVGPGASAFGTNGGQPASLGASFVDLLDLGTNRTLTLVNGRRYVSGNAATLFVQGNTTGAQVDLNSIPTSLVERLDVLTVGGAVAYGSDAIAGVVNAVLKDDFSGLRISGQAGITDQGDGGNYRLTAIGGVNFAEGRGNIAASFEYNRDNELLASSREAFRRGFIAPTSFRNGAVRNTTFTPGFNLNLTAGQGAFLPAATDLVPNNIAGAGVSGGSILISLPGTVFQANANITNLLPAAFQGIATTDPQNLALSGSFRPQVLISQAGNVNLVPGTPIATGNGCSLTNLTTFCNFAPTALPGTAATRTTFVNAVISRFAPTFATQGTAAQRDALALQLLQANIQTPREFLAANPNTDINAFIGTTIPNYLDIANPNAATAGLLPRVAVPLQFDDAGNLFAITPAIITDPLVTPSTTGGAATPNGFNTARFTPLRIAQDRFIVNLIGHFDITEDLTVYTENQYAHVRNISPSNLASSNTITSNTAENAALVFDLNNPFLDASDVATLRAAGVTNRFVVSRQNQDIVDGNTAEVTAETYRAVLGLKGDFGLFGRDFRFDTSFTYGRAESVGNSFQIRDIEYALAIDAVRDANGNIVCRAQTNPAAVGVTPFGVVGQELVREVGPDGVITERLVRRVATAEQVAGCRPLNPFGYAQFSDEARDYVLAETGFENIANQYFGQAILAGSLVDLPGGELGFALTGEYRREDLSYAPDTLSRFGATRTAALAETSGSIEAWEFAAEVRIPVFGEDFRIPLFRNLELTPGVRVVRQSGSAPEVRLLDGSLLNQNSSGDWNTIYSLAGSWRPIEMITFRGNYTRSIRQPSIVELFLGGQPAFTGVTDPCSSANIGGGLRPATRRANCEAAVIAANLATDSTSAAAFLNSYVPSGAGITGTFAGSPGLLPEKGRSWTVGGVFTPTFIPGLSLAADYINVEVRNQIIPTTIVTALQICFDSPDFPDTSTEVGVNVCSFFNRIGAGLERQFEVDNGFNSGFINLGAIKVKAVNATLDYDVPLSDIFSGDVGEFNVYANVYHLIDYLSASDGNFANALQSAGTFARPEWELQLRGRYENSGFFTQWTWNWQNETRIFNSGAPIPGTPEQNEVQDLLGNPAFGIHDATIGFSFGEERRFGMQFTVRNVFDKRIAGPEAQVFAIGPGRIDDFGRRYVLSVNARF